MAPGRRLAGTPAPDALWGMHSQIADVIGQFDAATNAARALVASMDDAAFARRPIHEKWSPAECLVHLNITTEAYLPLLDAAVAANAAAPRSDSVRYRKDAFGWFLSWIMEPPYRMRVKTPAAFVPGATQPRDAVMADVARLNAALADRARALAGLDLNQIKVPSVFGMGSYNAWSVFTILVAHQRRHLWQAECNRT